MAATSNLTPPTTISTIGAPDPKMKNRIQQRQRDKARRRIQILRESGLSRNFDMVTSFLEEDNIDLWLQKEGGKEGYHGNDDQISDESSRQRTQNNSKIINSHRPILISSLSSDWSNNVRDRNKRGLSLLHPPSTTATGSGTTAHSSSIHEGDTDLIHPEPCMIGLSPSCLLPRVLSESCNLVSLSSMHKSVIKTKTMTRRITMTMTILV